MDRTGAPVRCGVALGSNLGDRLCNLRTAFQGLALLHEGTPEELRASSIYETAPVGCEPGAGAYLNAVAEVRTRLPPFSFLERLRALELQLGRPLKRPRNAPRTIDLDVLYYDNLVLRLTDLVIPHPRLAQRRFVLAPLAEIAPDLILAGYTEPVAVLLARLVSDEEVRRLQDSLDEH